jgi:hypothetical protein
MGIPFHAIPTLAISVAALMFVAWISVSTGWRESLYADGSASAAAAR